MKNLILDAIYQSIRTKEGLRELVPVIERIAEVVVTTLKNDGKIFFFGNGGSAADAQHIAAELVGKLLLEGKGLPAVALTTNTSILTALGNDYGYEMIFERQVESLVSKGDVVIGISTSGNSINVIKGIEAAMKKGALTVALTGAKGGNLAKVAGIVLNVPSTNTQRIQEAHILVGHIVCEIVENILTSNKNLDDKIGHKMISRRAKKSIYG